VLRAQHTHLELAYGDKAVILPMVKVHKTHRGTLLTGPAILAHAGVFQEQREDVAVVFNQIGPGETGSQLLDHLLYLIVFQPVIDDLELRPQDFQHHNLGEALAVAVRWVLLAVEVKNFPLQTIKLIEEGFLDMVAFVEFDIIFIRLHRLSPFETNHLSYPFNNAHNGILREYFDERTAPWNQLGKRPHKQVLGNRSIDKRSHP